MKKNVKKLLIGALASAMTVFALFASGCSAQEKLDTWYDQLVCEHTKVEKVLEKAPTCTEDGYTEHEVCKSCEKEIGKKVIKATGHENITVIEGYAATCTTTGKTDGKYCNDCKKTVVEQKTIYALGHKRTYAKAEKETCTTDGHTSGWICGNDGCDYVYSGYELIPATGHDEDENGDCENCGKNLSILLSEVEVGMDLTGYALRLAVPENEFVEFMKSSSTVACLVSIDFETQYGTNEGGYITAGVRIDDTSANFLFPSMLGSGNYEQLNFIPYEYKNALSIVSHIGDDSYGYDHAVSSEYGKVSSVLGLDSELASYFKFVYVGFEGAGSAATSNNDAVTATAFLMNPQRSLFAPAMRKIDNKVFVDSFQYSMIVNEDEWTRIF